MPKKKRLHNKPLTIVKILSKGGTISQADLDRWRGIFQNKLMTMAEAEATGEVKVSWIPQAKEDEQVIALIKIGNEDYMPTMKDLEDWRAVFNDAMHDKDFKIFTHEHVKVQILKLGEIVAVE